MSRPTFAILVSKAGAHWSAAVRFGIKGQRALLGTLMFNWEDTYYLKHVLNYLADRLTTRVISRVIEQLGQDQLLRSWNPALLPLYGEQIRAEMHAFFAQEVLREFGVDAVEGKD